MSIQRQASTPSRYSIFNARELASHGDFQEAISNYLGVMHGTPPEGRSQYLTEFVAVLKAYFDAETEEARMMSVINEACTLPDLEFHVWRARSEWLYMRGDLLRSFSGFRRALSVVRSDVEWLHAVTSIENIKSNFIDAWHWRMINDAGRNMAYKKAICDALEEARNLQNNVNIIDVGCGSGIFSIIAYRCNGPVNCDEIDFDPTISSGEPPPITVYACETNKTMCTIAEACFHANHANSINLIPRHSTRITNFNDKCDILVTETLDCAIFGERIVESIYSAKENLLTRTRPHIIIPQKACAYFAAIQSEDIAMEHFCEINRKSVNASNASEAAYNFDEALPSTSTAHCSHDPMSSAPRKSEKSNEKSKRKHRTMFRVNSSEHEHPDDEFVMLSQFCYLEKRCRTKLFNSFVPTEPYTCQYLNALQSDYEFVSDVEEGLWIDFNDIEQLERFVSDEFHTEVKLTAARDGVVHAIICWFKAHLFNDSYIDTSPATDHCWQQAVFPIYPPKVLRKGEKFQCRVYVVDQKMYICPFGASGPKDHQSRIVLRATTDVNFTLMHNDDVQNFFQRAVKLGDFKQVVDCTDLLVFSEKVKPILKYEDVMIDGANKTKKETGKLQQQVAEIVEDENGDQTPITTVKEETIDLEKNTVDKNITEINSLNVVVASDVSIILHAADRSKRFSNVFKDVDVEAIEKTDSENHSTAILYWPLSSRGLIMDSYFATILGLYIEMKGCVNLIPSIMHLKCRLISSKEIVERTRIDNLFPGNNTARIKHCDVDLTPMNEYRQNYVHDIELYNDFAFDYLSDTFELYSIRFDRLTRPKNCVNELTKVRQVLEVEATKAGSCTAVLHWFEFSDGFGNQLRLPEEIMEINNTEHEFSKLSVNEDDIIQQENVISQPDGTNLVEISPEHNDSTADCSAGPTIIGIGICEAEKDDINNESITNEIEAQNKNSNNNNTNKNGENDGVNEDAENEETPRASVDEDLIPKATIQKLIINATDSGDNVLSSSAQPSPTITTTNVSTITKNVNDVKPTTESKPIHHNSNESLHFLREKKRRLAKDRVWSKASAYVMDRPVNTTVGMKVRVEASLYHGNVVFHSVLDALRYVNSPEYRQRQQLEALYQKQTRRVYQMHAYNQATSSVEDDDQELL